MSDSYQAVYDAVRSRICGDFVGAVESAARLCFEGFSYIPQHAQQQIYAVSHEHMRPSVLFKPELSVDGTKWCAAYGQNAHSGIIAFGDTPDEAMRAFDEAWTKEKTPSAAYYARTAPASAQGESK